MNQLGSNVPANSLESGQKGIRINGRTIFGFVTIAALSAMLATALVQNRQSNIAGQTRQQNSSSLPGQGIEDNGPPQSNTFTLVRYSPQVPFEPINFQPTVPLNPLENLANQAQAEIANIGEEVLVKFVDGYEAMLDPVFKGSDIDILERMRQDMFGASGELPSMHNGASGILREFIKQHNPKNPEELKALVMDSLLAYAQTTRQPDGTFIQYSSRDYDGTLKTGDELIQTPEGKKKVISKVTISEDEAFNLAIESFGSVSKLLTETGSALAWNNSMATLGMPVLALADDWDTPTTNSPEIPVEAVGSSAEAIWQMPDSPIYNSNFEVVQGMNAAQYADMLKGLTPEEIRAQATFVKVNFTPQQARTLNLNGTGSPETMLFVRDIKTGNIIPNSAMSANVLDALIQGISNGDAIDINIIPTQNFADGNFYNGMFQQGNIGAELQASNITVKALKGFDINGSPINITQEMMSTYKIRGIELRNYTTGPADFVLAFYAQDGSGQILFANANSSMTNLPKNIHAEMRHNMLNFESPALQSVTRTIESSTFQSAIGEFAAGKSVTIDGVVYKPIVIGTSANPTSGSIGRNMTIIPELNGQKLPPVFVSQPNTNAGYARVMMLSPEEAALIGRIPEGTLWQEGFTPAIERYVTRGGQLTIADGQGNLTNITAANQEQLFQAMKQADVDVLPPVASRLGKLGPILKANNIISGFSFVANGLTIVSPAIKAWLHSSEIANTCGDQNCDLTGMFAYESMTAMSRSGSLIYTEPTFAQIDVTKLAQMQQTPDQKYAVFTMGEAGYESPGNLLSLPVVLLSTKTATPFEVFLDQNAGQNKSTLRILPLADFSVQVIREGQDIGTRSAMEMFYSEAFDTNVVDNIPSFEDLRDGKVKPPNYIMMSGTGSWNNKVVVMSFTDRSGSQVTYILNFEDDMILAQFEGPTTLARLNKVEP